MRFMRTMHPLVSRLVILPPMLALAGFVQACGSAPPSSAPPSSSTESPAASALAGAAPASQADVARVGTNGPGLRRASTTPLQLPVRRTLDLSHVQPGAFATALGRDPVRIFEFVRDQIAFEPYVGALRGPRGTLLAMAGNSVDRAALLASLLTSAGQRVRFARGTLPDSEARELVSSIWADRSVAVPDEAGGESPEVKAAADQLVMNIERDAVLLHDTLKKAGHPGPGEADVTESSILKEIRDHYWVEWSRDGGWTSMDPSFAAATPGHAYAKTEQSMDALPDSLFHQVHVRVRVEEYTGATPSTREVVSYTAKAADLSSADLLVAHQPDEDNTPSTSRVRPVLIAGNEQIVGLSFTLRAPRGNAFGGLADFLGGGADPSGATATAELIEMEFIAPGGARETVVREIFDRVGPKRRIAAQSLTAEQVAAATGSVSLAEFTSALYNLHITTGAVDTTHLLNLAASTPETEKDLTDARAGLRRLHIAFAAISDKVLGRLAATNGWVGRTYVETPRVHISDLSEVGGAPRLRFDLRRDGARVVVSGFRREPLFRTRLLRAVVNGALERTVTEHFVNADGAQGPAAPAFSTSYAFERARASNAPVIFLSGNSAGLGADVPEEARARIDAAIKAGNVLVAPQAPVLLAGAPRLAWWQVDPRTGAAVAMTDDGLHGGQPTVEAGIIRTSDGRTHVMFRTSQGYRIFRFGNQNQANRFITQMGQRFQRANVNVNWIAIM